jgi:predicted membrane protein
LRQASPKDNAYLEITAVFGSVSIMIPSNWKVVKHGGPVFGKVNDNRINVPGDGFMKTVTIEMNAIFGHVDLVN